MPRARAAIAELQRSRTRWSAESNMRLYAPSSLHLLQRSRTRWSAERTYAAFWMNHFFSFNGAALVGVRRAADKIKLADQFTKLQRSRTRWSAESQLHQPGAIC